MHTVIMYSGISLQCKLMETNYNLESSNLSMSWGPWGVGRINYLFTNKTTVILLILPLRAVGQPGFASAVGH